MHETSAGTWCSGKTWRVGVGWVGGGGIGMGKTCEPKAFSFQCMTKFTTNKKRKKEEKKKEKRNMLIHWITFFTLPIFNKPSHCAHLHYLPGSLKYLNIINVVNFPGGPDGKESNLPTMPETQVRSPGWEDPLEKRIATHSSILSWRTPWTRAAWWATVQRVTESGTIEWLFFYIALYTCKKKKRKKMSLSNQINQKTKPENEQRKTKIDTGKHKEKYWFRKHKAKEFIKYIEFLSGFFSLALVSMMIF